MNRSTKKSEIRGCSHPTPVDNRGSGRMVSMKPANKPFLKAKERRESYRQRKSEKSNPWTTLLFVLIFLPLLSSFTTNTYTFTLGPRYLPKIKKWVATNDFNPFKTELRTFSPDQLRKFDGRDRWLPVYIAILGQVYDVTKNRRIYGQGGSYNMMCVVCPPDLLISSSLTPLSLKPVLPPGVQDQSLERRLIKGLVVTLVGAL